MAAHAKTFTIGSADTTIDIDDLTSSWGGGILIGHKANTGVIWVSLNSNVAASADGDDCFPVEPGDRVAFTNFPLRIFSTAAAQKLTIAPNSIQYV